MNHVKNVYIIVCEGFSEKAYLQELNRYLDYNNYPFTFVAKPIKNGHFKPAKNKYTEIKKQNPQNKIYIWVDKDTYIRNDEGDGKKYISKPQNLPDFLFNYNNFEDFLAMHLSKSILDKWQEICRKNKHFESPLPANKYMPLYQENVINCYEKANMPFAITEEVFSNALNAQKDITITFKSDFLNLLNTLTQEHN